MNRFGPDGMALDCPTCDSWDNHPDCPDCGAPLLHGFIDDWACRQCPWSGDDHQKTWTSNGDGVPVRPGGAA